MKDSCFTDILPSWFIIGAKLVHKNHYTITFFLYIKFINLYFLIGIYVILHLYNRILSKNIINEILKLVYLYLNILFYNFNSLVL